jgi:hypothetical protein
LEDYTTNSKRSKEVKGVTKKEPLEPVVTGEVIQKPKGPGRKFKEVFFGGDAKEAGKYVLVDVMLPSLRNLIVDAITKGVEGLVYGESGRRRRPTDRTSYNTRYQVNGPQTAAPRNIMDLMSGGRGLPPDPRGRQNRHNIDDIVVSSKAEADLIIERMMDVVEKYDVVSLSDLYELLNIETSHVDLKWGWTHMRGAQVRQVRQGYLLELPPLEEI